MTESAPSRPHLRRNLILVAACVVALVAGIAGIGSLRTASDAIEAGVTIGADSVSLPTTFRVATMNIHSAVGTSGREDLQLTARTLDGIDIAGLNEVRGALVGATQVEQLAKLTGMTGEFFASERQYWHDAFGNALLTRLPPARWNRQVLPAGDEGSRRNVNVVIFGNDQLTILVTHIARHEDQAPQLDYVSKLFLEQKPPVILMGDMNASSDNPQIAKLLGTEGVRNPLDEKHPDLRGKHIDWILVRGLDVRDAGVRDLGASDHPMFWAELAFPSPTTQP